MKKVRRLDPLPHYYEVTVYTKDEIKDLLLVHITDALVNSASRTEKRKQVKDTLSLMLKDSDYLLQLSQLLGLVPMDAEME